MSGVQRQSNRPIHTIVKAMEEEKQNGGVVNHFEKDSNCQVFNAPVTGCVFAMPGSTVIQQTGPQAESKDDGENHQNNNNRDRDEKQFQFIHYSISKEEGWAIHDEIKNLVARQKIQMICKCLKEMHNGKKLLLPSDNPSAVYKELVRMGMPNGKGFSEVSFRKYYMTNK